VVAELDKGKGEYVLNGRKYWPCNSGGWDLKGADVNVVIVRTAPSEDGKQGLSGMLVPRGARGMRFERPISKIGHRLCQNNDIVFENCRVPEENVFALGNGDLIISKAFTWSGPVAAIAAVGVARSAYEYVLKWAKTYTAGSDKPIIHYLGRRSIDFLNSIARESAIARGSKSGSAIGSRGLSHRRRAEPHVGAAHAKNSLLQRKTSCAAAAVMSTS
jgi:hypothetical protein